MPPAYGPAIGRNLANQRRANANIGNSGGGIPGEITCYVCKKKKPRSQFANRQIQRFADTISNPYAPAGRTLSDPKTTCRKCTPQQVTELTCCICEKTKGLGYFAKSQRKHPDTARCIKCLGKHLDTEPDGEYADSDSEDDSESEAGDFDEEVPTDKPLIRRSAATMEASGNETTAVASFDNSTDMPHVAHSTVGAWQNVPAAGNYLENRAFPLPSYASGGSVNSSQHTATGKGNWAKVPKVSGSGSGSRGGDEWDQYSRELTKRRDANKRNAAPKKTKQKITLSEDDEDWD